jgi:hypothetical protein
MGFGVAVALFLDATLVRLVILPSVLTLLGDRSWHLPAWLEWLPHLEIEPPADRPTAGPETGAPSTLAAWHPLDGPSTVSVRDRFRPAHQVTQHRRGSSLPPDASGAVAPRHIPNGAPQ